MRIGFAICNSKRPRPTSQFEKLEKYYKFTGSFMVVFPWFFFSFFFVCYRFSNIKIGCFTIFSYNYLLFSMILLAYIWNGSHALSFSKILCPSGKFTGIFNIYKALDMLAKYKFRLLNWVAYCVAQEKYIERTNVFCFFGFIEENGYH